MSTRIEGTDDHPEIEVGSEMSSVSTDRFNYLFLQSLIGQMQGNIPPTIKEWLDSVAEWKTPPSNWFDISEVCLWAASVSFSHRGAEELIQRGISKSGLPALEKNYGLLRKVYAPDEAFVKAEAKVREVVGRYAEEAFRNVGPEIQRDLISPDYLANRIGSALSTGYPHFTGLPDDIPLDRAQQQAISDYYKGEFCSFDNHQLPEILKPRRFGHFALPRRELGIVQTKYRGLVLASLLTDDICSRSPEINGWLELGFVEGRRKPTLTSLLAPAIFASNPTVPFTGVGWVEGKPMTVTWKSRETMASAVVEEVIESALGVKPQRNILSDSCPFHVLGYNPYQPQDLMAATLSTGLTLDEAKIAFGSPAPSYIFPKS